MKALDAFLKAQKKFRQLDIASASIDAEVLLLAAINKNKKKSRDKSWLYINYKDYELTKEENYFLNKFITRRSKEEPIAYILNSKEFYGLDFFVDKNVLIPRNETELIVEKVIDFLKQNSEKFTLIDLGTGSGCIPISIAKQRISQDRIKKIIANDISPKAIMIAKMNAKKHKVMKRFTFLQCDLQEAINKTSKDKKVIITANLPYISEKNYKKLSPTVKKFEPKLALTAEKNGLEKIEKMIECFCLNEPKKDQYVIFIEADPLQMKSIIKIIKDKVKNLNIEIIKDLRNKKRLIKISKN